MSNETAVPPPVLWAQRSTDVFLTFSIESKDPTIKIEKDSVYFKGVNVSDNKIKEVTIPLYDAVVPESSSFVNKGRCIEMILRKEKTDAPYWPSLTNDKMKRNYIKIDFNKWKDEDDDDEAVNGNQEPYDFGDMLKSMSGAYGDNAEDNSPSFDETATDSDDENLPDLE